MAKSPSATATPAAFGGPGAPAEQASRPARGGESWGRAGVKRSAYRLSLGRLFYKPLLVINCAFGFAARGPGLRGEE